MTNISNAAYIAAHVSAAQAAEREGRWGKAVDCLRLVLARQGEVRVRHEAMRHIDRLVAKSRAIGRAAITYAEGPGRLAAIQSAHANMARVATRFSPARLP